MAMDMIKLILSDGQSRKKYHYAGVVGRKPKFCMADHENYHGKCNFGALIPTADKDVSLVKEMISIWVLMAAERFGMIGGCLNFTTGGDGFTASENYNSPLYHNYSYWTATPFESENTEGKLYWVNIYKEITSIIFTTFKTVFHAVTVRNVKKLTKNQ